jgi:hypothetical protein
MRHRRGGGSGHGGGRAHGRRQRMSRGATLAVRGSRQSRRRGARHSAGKRSQPKARRGSAESLAQAQAELYAS